MSAMDFPRVSKFQGTYVRGEMSCICFKLFIIRGVDPLMSRRYKLNPLRTVRRGL